MPVSMTELNQRIQTLETLWTDCRACGRDCGVNRLEGELGICGLGREIRIYKEHIHYGEECSISPSHTVYLTGCSFRCTFCSDDSAVQEPQKGTILSSEDLAQLISQRQREGARNVHFVGGEPSVNALGILEALRQCAPLPPVVWNTNAYHSGQLLPLLSGLVDTWIADLKFGSDDCGRIAGVQNYTQVAHPAVKALEADPGKLIVRHLLMPGHVECCTRPVLHWLATHAPQATVNLMTGWLPLARARRDPQLNTRIQPMEHEKALELFSTTPLQSRMLNGHWWNGDLNSTSGLER